MRREYEAYADNGRDYLFLNFVVSIELTVKQI